MEIEATLTKLPFWDNLSEQERTLTKCGATHRTYEKGVYIFDYSDSCIGMVYIQKGSIRVFITSEEGREVTLFHISEGGCCVFSSACVIGGVTLDVQMVAELADEYQGKAIIGKVNVDEEPELAASFSVASIPMFVVMKGGKIANTKIGAMPKANLEAMLK